MIRALNGRWYYSKHAVTGQVVRDSPKKPNHPDEDLGDAYCYLMAMLLEMERPTGEFKVETAFNLDEVGRTPAVVTSFQL